MMSNEHKAALSSSSVTSPRKFRFGRNRSYAGGTSDRKDWHVALIDGSDDAIVSRSLDGVIQSWNDAATRLFGYSADETIGQSIAMLIPEDRLEEELAILAQIRRGKRVGCLETKRRRKDGSLIDIALTTSVIRNAEGVIVGASKIARDITQMLMAQEQQRLLMYELRHRVKNLFALAAAIVSISARSAGSGKDVIEDIRARLSSLARAHDMMMSDRPHDAQNPPVLSLLMLIHRLLDPYAAADGRVVIGGHDCDVGAKAVPYLSLLFYELATNAAKFGSLSVGSGRLDVNVVTDADMVRLLWRETGGPAPSTDGPTGFGSRLEQSVTCALNTKIERDWRRTGLVAVIAIPKAALIA